MRALRFSQFGDPAVLRLTDLPDPVATGREAVIRVEAAPDVRAKRLSSRGRESEAEVAARLSREVPAVLDGAVCVDNSGELAAGVAAFVRALRAIAGA